MSLPHDHRPEDGWKTTGVRVIPGDQLDENTAQTPGMNRAAAINFARVGARKIWAGTVHIHANAKTGAHHHGALESVIYVIKGRARMRWGEALEFVAEAGPGDFIYVPPFVPHQEINASADETLECVLVRSDNEAVVVNLDIQPVETPEAVAWVDPIHRAPDCAPAAAGALPLFGGEGEGRGRALAPDRGDRGREPGLGQTVGAEGVQIGTAVEDRQLVPA
jgi:uncharacterized RmlC-like cupin family protein